MPLPRRIALLLAGLGIAAIVSGISAAPLGIWARGFGGPGRERATGVAPDRGGTIYTVGQVAGKATWGSVRVTSAGPDALVASLDLNGQVVWAHALGGPGPDEARAVAILPEGDVFVVGSFSGTADFDPGPGRTELASAGSTDVFVLRLTPRGELVWARRFGGLQEDTGLDIAVDTRGVYVSGSFQSALDAGPSRLTSAGKTDGFAAKLDLSGTLQWTQRIGGPQNDEARSLAVDANGEVWVAGSFEEKAGIGQEGGSSWESAGKLDGFLARLGPEGAVLWSGRIGGKKEDAVTAVAVGPAGVWLTGYFTDTADFDPGSSITTMAGVGKADAFVARLAKTGQLRWVQQTSGPYFDTGTGLAPDGEGGVWALSVQIERYGFHLDPESTDDRAVLTRFDRDGARKITREMAGEGGLRALDVALDSAGNPCVAGAFRGKGTVITGFEVVKLTGAGQTDALVARIVK
ncbi:MAG TPA: SBBP repeat-containing protein [Thermoanaerobaculia bacterium]|nr:SBBP repeat-containing protein [Thermoanaerobaculia bacterium]